MTFKQYMMENYVKIPERINLQIDKMSHRIIDLIKDYQNKLLLKKDEPYFIGAFEDQNIIIKIYCTESPTFGIHPGANASVYIKPPKPFAIYIHINNVIKYGRNSLSSMSKLLMHELTHIFDKHIGTGHTKKRYNSKWEWYAYAKTPYEINARLNEYLYNIEMTIKSAPREKRLHIYNIYMRFLKTDHKEIIRHYVDTIISTEDSKALFIKRIMTNKKFIKQLINATYKYLNVLKDKYDF